MKQLFSALQTALAGWPFWCSALLLFLLCCMSGVTLEGESAPALQVIFAGDRARWLLHPEVCSAQAIWLNYDELYWFHIVLPVLVSLPTVYAFYDEWFSGAYYFCILRTGRRRYSLCKLLSSGISGVLTVVFGLALFFLLTAAVFPGAAQYDDPEWFWMLYGGMAAYHAMLLKKIGNLLLLAFIAPLLSLLLTVALRDKFLALSVPMVLVYLSSQLAGMYTLALWRGNIPPALEGISLLFPSGFHTLYITFPRYTGLPFFLAALILLLCFVGFGLLFHTLLERRIRCGA